MRHAPADARLMLPGSGAAAYLDIEAMIDAARQPGYGFLSENAGFARHCHEASPVLVGPSPAVLDLFGEKLQAMAEAIRSAATNPANRAQLMQHGNLPIPEPAQFASKIKPESDLNPKTIRQSIISTD
jgi:acetyl/propionyl-CoA carboxylase alpha subunit